MQLIWRDPDDPDRVVIELHNGRTAGRRGDADLAKVCRGHRVFEVDLVGACVEVRDRVVVPGPEEDKRVTAATATQLLIAAKACNNGVVHTR